MLGGSQRLFGVFLFKGEELFAGFLIFDFQTLIAFREGSKGGVLIFDDCHQSVNFLCLVAEQKFVFVCAGDGLRKQSFGIGRVVLGLGKLNRNQFDFLMKRQRLFIHLLNGFQRLIVLFGFSQKIGFCLINFCV